MKETKRTTPNRRIFYIVVSLVAALALWIYVRTMVNPYSDPWVYRIPVTFVGEEALTEEREMILLAGQYATVDLHVYGKRTDTATLDRSNVTVSVDLSTVRSAGTYALEYEISFPDNIGDNAITILEQTPSSVEISVGKMLTKKIPVYGSGGSPAEGYLAETMICEPNEITVRGPEEIVKQLHHAEVYLDREELDRTVNTTLPFTLMDNNENVIEDEQLVCDVTEIAVELPIMATKEVDLTVELIDGGGATSHDADVDISPEKITISGDAELLKGINQISLGTIKLSEVLVQATLQRPIVLPNDTEILSGEEDANITVELVGLNSRTIRTTNIELIDLPDEENYQYDIVSKSLNVVIRGKTAVVEQIYASNLRAVADLSDYTEPGQYKIPVTVYVDGYSDVGILHEEEYTIVVTISEKTEEPTPEPVAEPEPEPENSAEKTA